MSERTNKDAMFWQMMDGRLPPPPSAVTLGAHFDDIDTEKGTIEASFVAKPEFVNPAGVVQGGFLAAMLDDTLGPALVATLEPDHFAPTLNLNVQFHRPGKVGPMKAFGRITMRGKEICHMSGELLQDGKVVASATATAVIKKLQR